MVTPPVAKEDNTVVFGIPVDLLQDIKKGIIPFSELQQYVLSSNDDVPATAECIFVGTGLAVVLGIIKPS